jgi:hypothetical protein
MSGARVSDEEFMCWAESFKTCRYCRSCFIGPICECERKERHAAKSDEAIALGSALISAALAAKERE